MGRARNNEPTSELNFGGLRWFWYWYFPWIHTLVGFKMKAWKGVVFMWSAVGMVVLLKVIMIYPRDVANFITHNPQIIGSLISLPIMIFMLFWLKGMMGGSKKPNHWWTEDKDEF
jgi:hypothetical protein